MEAPAKVSVLLTMNSNRKESDMSTLTINIRDLLKSSLGNSITHVPCAVDLEELLDFNDIIQCTIDIQEALNANRQIAIIWSIEDVKDRRPDLSDDQAWQVLQSCQRQHDCNFGLTWETLDSAADMLFGSGNEHRVERCQLALRKYNGDDDDDANLVDLLTDAMHLCRKNDREFKDFLNIAEQHFSAETEE